MLRSNRVSDWIVNHPLITVVLLLAGVGVCLLRIGHLEIDASTRGMINEKDPQKARYEQFKKDFGSDILSAVVLTPPEGDVFTFETLEIIDVMTEAIWEMDGVDEVVSLSNIRNITGTDDVLITDELIEYLPETEEELTKVRRDAMGSELIVGNVVSPDGKRAAINVYTDNRDDKDFDAHFIEALDEVINTHRGSLSAYQVGAPRYNTNFASYIKRDQITLVPLAVFVIMLVFWVAFRAGVGVLLPLVTSTLSIAAMAGFMSWMGYSLSVVSVMAPSVMIVVGCTEDVHLLWKYRAGLRDGLDKVGAIRYMMDRSLIGITLTSLTTMIGFSVLAFDEITAIREFAVICTFGLFANFLVTVISTPALFRIMPAPITKVGKRDLMGSLLAHVHRFNMKNRRLIAIGTGALALGALWGLSRVKVNNDPVSFFKDASEIRRDFDRINTDMVGAQSFHITFDVAEGDVKEPDFLRRVDRLQAHMNVDGSYDKTLSLGTFVKLMNRAINNDPEQYTIPNDRGAIAQYLIFLEGEDLARYVEQTYSRTTISVRHAMNGSMEVNAAVSDLESWLSEHMSYYVKDGSTHPIKWNITGESILLHRATDALIRGQAKGLLIALTVIFGVISLLFLSLKAGAVAMISNVVPILFNFGMMGLLDIPFNTGTCLLATIALGIAVDDTIHFMVRYNRALREKQNQEEALKRALVSEGHPILITTVALALGFVVMSASPFNPTMYFGILAALIMVYALIADLFVNPLLLLSVQLITVWDFIRLKINPDVLEKSFLLAGLKPSQAKTFVLLGNLRECERGERLITEGDKGDHMYLVLKGEADVSVNADGSGDKVVATLGEGEMIGETALLGQGVRTASVTAKEPMTLLTVDDPALRRVTHRNPEIAAKVFRNMSRRLSERVQKQTRVAVSG